MKVRAQSKFIRQSPSKVRLVLDLIRGLSIDEARATLAHTNRRAVEPVRKTLDSAVANAEHNYALGADELWIAAAFADEGPTLRRFRPRARGRATRIRKRTCHITIVVGDDEEGED